MTISIKGINTGVIRQKNEFVALALKIKEPRNKESLFFLSPLDQEICLSRSRADSIQSTSLAKTLVCNMKKNVTKPAKKCTKISL